MSTLAPLPPRQPGRTLDRAAYTSPDVFEADIRRVFFRSWLFVGHECQLPKAGDFLNFEFAGESILITRARAGDLHAFFNVCRHRGSRLTSDPAGSTKCFVCPYHQWSYELDGSLRSAATMNDQLDKSAWPLQPARLSIWNGFIYICPDPAANLEPVNEILAPATAALHRHNLPHLQLAHRIDYDIPANWKLFMENYRECYHCRGAHPQFCATVPVGDLDEHRTDSSARLIKRPDGTFTRYAVRPGATTDSLDGQPVSIPLGSLSPADSDLHGLCFYPAHAMVIGHDNVMAFSVRPLTPLTCKLTACWYVHADARPGTDFDPSKVAAFWDVTNQQDIELCRINQLGVNSRRYTPGPYHPTQEDDVEHFLNFYTAKLR